ncbi:MAG TPA: methionine--tRNA ligase [Myxococcota bacterium]|nr:methionine--tRNA ligase [Myxococcota bacterium]
MSQPFYVTTPIYYVNDRPHIGHLYTTTVADVIARHRRQAGSDVFFLTGTDEHAAKVADAAAERGIAPLAWADRNAEIFQSTFGRYGISNDDFIRTTEARHTEKVQRWVAQLLETGDVYLGEYEGWYDAGEEEYVPDARAEELGHKSPISGRELVRKKEKNYFFKLSAYGDALLTLLEERPTLVQPDARRNEVIGRIREGLNDVPLSRTGTGDWGIEMPGDPDHRVYVWIDALFNYLSAVDTDARRHYWPASLHLIAKDILWFHAVIWPALLLALRRVPGNDWIELPRQVYAHSFWISEGRKMSKTLGNFVDLEKLEDIVSRYGLDALRYYLVSQGPLSVNDADFAAARFDELYHAELANKLGNLVSRTLHMNARFADGRVPEPGPTGEPEAALVAAASLAGRTVAEQMERYQVGRALDAALELAAATNRYLDEREPWKAAKDPARADTVPTTLYHCCEALRLVAHLLVPFLPAAAGEIFARLGLDGAPWPDDPTRFGGLPAGLETRKGDALFPRVERAQPAAG